MRVKQHDNPLLPHKPGRMSQVASTGQPVVLRQQLATKPPEYTFRRAKHVLHNVVVDSELMDNLFNLFIDHFQTPYD